MLFLNETPELSHSEIDIYKYVINHLEQIQYMKIRDLADATFTSTASILRFCHKFGCAGYSEFKVRLQFYI